MTNPIHSELKTPSHAAYHPSAGYFSIYLFVRHLNISLTFVTTTNRENKLHDDERGWLLGREGKKLIKILL